MRSSWLGLGRIQGGYEMRRKVPWHAAVLLIGLPTLLPAPSAGQAQLPFQVVVNASNPSEPVTSSWVAKAFLHKVRRWPDGEAVVPVDLEVDSFTRAAFTRAIHRKSVRGIESFWQRQIFSGGSPPPPRKERDADVIAFVRERPGAIGYVSPRAVLGEGVRVLEIDFEGEVPPAPARAGDNSFLLRSGSSYAALSVDPRYPDRLFAVLDDGALFRSHDGGRTWDPVRHGLDTRLRSVVADPRRALLIGEDGQQIYYSIDDGQTWEPASGLRVQGPIRSLALTPGSVLYVLTGGRLLQSHNLRSHFSTVEIPAADEISAFVFDPFHPGLLAASENVVWRSNDRGDAWWELGEIAPDVGEIQLLAADPGTWGLVIAAATGGVFRSLDGALSWERLRLPGPISDLRVNGEVVVAVGKDSLYRSLDSGTTWETVVDLLDAALTADPNNPGRLFALGRRGRLWASLNGGRTWHQLAVPYQPPPPPPPQVVSEPAPEPVRLHLNCSSATEHVAALAVDPAQPAVVYAAGSRGVYKSLDHGTTWAFAGRGLEITDVHTLVIDPERTATLYAGTHGAGVFKSTDGGVSWSPARAGLGRVGDPGMVVHSLIMAPRRRDAHLEALYAGTAAGLYLSEDAGRTWRLRELTPDVQGTGPKAEHLPVLSLASDPRRATYAGAASTGGELWTGETDDTATWSRLPRPVAVRGGRLELDPEECSNHRSQRPRATSIAQLGLDPRGLRVRSLLFDRYEPDVLYAATALGLWRSEERGTEPFSKESFSANVAAVAAFDPLGLLAGTERGVWLSDDREEWRALSLQAPVFSLAVGPGEPHTFFAGLDRGRLGLSRDSGQTWSAGPLPTVRGREILAEPEPLAPRPVSGPRPTEVSPAARRLWEILWQEKPVLSARCKTLVANELLSRTPADFEKPVRNALEDFLEEALAAELELAGAPQNLRFSPRQGWLLARYDLGGCGYERREMRLFDLATVRPRPRGPERGSRFWARLHDLTLEPPHLPPSRVLPDAGTYLAWSENDRFLATRDEERVRVWDLSGGRPTSGHGAPDTLSPRTPPQPWEVDIDWDSCTRASTPRRLCTAAISGDGRWLAYSGIGESSTTLWVARKKGSDARVDELWTLPKGSEGPVFWQHLRFTPDHRRLLAFASDGTLWVARLSDSIETADEPVFETGKTWGQVTASPHRRWLAVGDSRLLVWPLAAKSELARPIELRVPGNARHLVWSGDERWLATQTSGGETLIFDLEAPSPQKEYRRFEHRDELGVFSQDSRFWISFGKNANRILNLATQHHRVTSGTLSGVMSRWPRGKRWSHLLRNRSFERDASTWLLAQNHDWLIESRRGYTQLWQLSYETPLRRRVQITRLGPVEPERDPQVARAWLAWPQTGLRHLDTPRVRELACQAIGRNLTPHEWRALLGDEPWRPTCVREPSAPPRAVGR